MILKRVNSFAIDVSRKLKNVPEVTKSCIWMKTNTNEFATIIQRYIDLIAKLDTYKEKDLDWIKRANTLMKKRRLQNTSASNLRADVFLKLLSIKKESFKTTTVEAFDQTNPFYQKALLQLADMMYLGHKMFANGGTPKDGDPESDKVIWGHTQARRDINPVILVHFIVCHYLARFISLAFDTTELKNKDAFLAVLIDVVLLEETKKPGSTDILGVWLTPRGKGGLEWLVQDQLEAYNDTKAIQKE